MQVVVSYKIVFPVSCLCMCSRDVYCVFTPVLWVFYSGGRVIYVYGHHLDVVQEPRILVTVYPGESGSLSRRRRRKRRSGFAAGLLSPDQEDSLLGRHRRIIPEPDCPNGMLCSAKQVRLSYTVSLCQDTLIMTQ